MLIEHQNTAVIDSGAAGRIAGDFSSVTGISGTSPVDYFTLAYGRDETSRYWHLNRWIASRTTPWAR